MANIGRKLASIQRVDWVRPIAEGLVFKSITVPGKSFKVINNKYLLKEK